jgi:hypothetical protein
VPANAINSPKAKARFMSYLLKNQIWTTSTADASSAKSSVAYVKIGTIRQVLAALLGT